MSLYLVRPHIPPEPALMKQETSRTANLKSSHKKAFNLIEIFLLIIPFEWWLSTDRYERLNNYVMGIIYSPLLLITAFIETNQAQSVRQNRLRGEQDDDTTEEWEQLDGELDFESEGWTKTCQDSAPNVQTDAAVLEVRELKKDVEELKGLTESLAKKEGSSGG